MWLWRWKRFQPHLHVWIDSINLLVPVLFFIWSWVPQNHIPYPTFHLHSILCLFTLPRISPSSNLTHPCLFTFSLCLHFLTQPILYTLHDPLPNPSCHYPATLPSQPYPFTYTVYTYTKPQYRYPPLSLIYPQRKQTHTYAHTRARARTHTHTHTHTHTPVSYTHLTLPTIDDV